MIFIFYTVQRMLWTCFKTVVLTLFESYGPCTLLRISDWKTDILPRWMFKTASIFRVIKEHFPSLLAPFHYRFQVVQFHFSEGKGSDSDVGLNWFTWGSENFDLPKAKLNRRGTIRILYKFNQATNNDGTI